MMTDLRKTLEAFRRRWEITWSYYVDMDKDLAKRLRKMRDDLRQDEQETDLDLLRQYQHIDRIYTNLFREGVLIQICSSLEYTMRHVCTLLVDQYAEAYSKKKGNWLQKNLALLKSTGSVNVKPEDVNFFCDFIRLRNCFVHSGGNVKKYRFQEQLRKAIDGLQELGKEPKMDMVGETKDGYVLLGADVLAEVVIRGEDIIRAVFNHAFDHTKTSGTSKQDN